MQPSGDDPAGDQLTAEAARIVADIVGRRTVQAETIPRGVMTFKCLVRTACAGDFVVRFYPPGRRAVVECEPELWARCRAAGLPVPRVPADSRTGPRASLAYVAYHRIQGDPLADHLPCLGTDQRLALATDLARWISRLQRIELDGFGELLDGRIARDATWAAFVERSLLVGLQAITANRLLDAPLVSQVSTVVAMAERLLRPTAGRLVWGDITFDNVLVDCGRVSGFIDFENCLSGDPLATLGCCFAVHGDGTFCETVLDVVTPPLEPLDRDRVMLYAVLRALRLAPYAHLPLPTGHRRDPLVRIFPGLVPALSQLSRDVSTGMGGKA